MNPFSKNYRPQIKLQPDWKSVKLHNTPKSEREKMVLADAPNQMHIPNQDENDRSKAVRGRRVGV